MQYTSIEDLCDKNPFWPRAVSSEDVIQIPDLYGFIFDLSRGSGKNVYTNGDTVVLVGEAIPLGSGYIASINYAGYGKIKMHEPNRNFHQNPLQQKPPNYKLWLQKALHSMNLI